MTFNHASGVATLEDFVTRQKAAGAERLVAGIEADNARTRWAKEILATPEAKSRPRAAARLIELSAPRTMPVERARATLRGLNVETGERVDTVSAPSAASDDSRAARLEEIRRNVGLPMRAARGDMDARRELSDLAVAEAARRHAQRD